MREPWPNRAAFDLGCSRECRIEHTYQWGRCAIAVAPPPNLNLYMFEVFTASDGHQSMRHRPVTTAEALAEIERFRTATEEAPDAR